MSKVTPRRNKAGDVVNARDLAQGDRINYRGREGVVTFLIRRTPFVRWTDDNGGEGELFDLSDIEVVIR